eukprot:m.378676 g.378676  ORF g.378676 m.378676 type:complete len:66 (+) comp95022_c0_seq1:54-251(+)
MRGKIVWQSREVTTIMYACGIHLDVEEQPQTQEHALLSHSLTTSRGNLTATAKNRDKTKLVPHKL